MKNCSKKMLLLLICIFTCFYTSSISAQDLECGMEEIHQQKMQTDPDYAKRYNTVEDGVLKRSIDYYNSPLKSNEDVLTIPVVVHIMHADEDTIIGTGINLKQSYIEYMVETKLNDDFSDVNGSVNTNIEFCLASADPDGNPTNGVTRNAASEYTDLYYTLQGTEIMKTTYNWDVTKYMNVYVVDNVYILKYGIFQPVAGLTHYPTAYGYYYDGIVVNDNAMSPPLDSRVTLTHEAGHYLNLKHIFEGGCLNNDCLTDGDCVCDTRPDDIEGGGCPSYNNNSCPTDVNQNDPNNPFTTDENDTPSNFMDYYVCQEKFTEGQKVRMRDALLNIRTSLLNSHGCGSCYRNLDLTGTVASIKYFEVTESIITSQNLFSSIPTSIEYNAGDYIMMTEGFNTNNGEVCAYIEGCDWTNGSNNARTVNRDEEIDYMKANNSNNKSNISSDLLIDESIYSYPNPFSHSTTIHFDLLAESKVGLKIYDSTGKEVAILIDDENKSQGSYQIDFDGSNLKAGIYFYVIQTDEYTVTKKVVMHK